VRAGLDELPSLAVFAHVVRENGFAAAGARLGLSRSAVSKHVARLERRLGTQLLRRTTRRLSLTEAGQSLYERAAPLLDLVAGAEAEVGRLAGAARGTLRVSAPMSFGQRHLAPLLAEFLRAHEGLRVELRLDDAIVDLIEGGFDCAVRIGELADSSLTARRLAPARRVVCGAPEYLERRGVPQTPDDLRRHDCLGYTYQASRAGWPFVHGKRQRTVRIDGRLEANNGEVLRAAALAGLGLALLPTFIVGDDLRAGTLRPVLQRWCNWNGSVHAVWPATRHTPPKVRAFVDFLARRCGDAPYWDAEL